MYMAAIAGIMLAANYGTMCIMVKDMITLVGTAPKCFMATAV